MSLLASPSLIATRKPDTEPRPKIVAPGFLLGLVILVSSAPIAIGLYLMANEAYRDPKAYLD
jgi:hypothetical protein